MENAIRDGIFDIPNRTLHLDMASRLMRLVALRASGDDLSELRGDPGLPGDEIWHGCASTVANALWQC